MSTILVEPYLRDFPLRESVTFHFCRNGDIIVAHGKWVRPHTWVIKCRRYSPEFPQGRFNGQYLIDDMEIDD